MKVLGVVCLILAVIGVFVFVPTTGGPRDVGLLWTKWETQPPGWQFLYSTSPGEIDYPRMAIQTFLLVGIAFICFHKKKPQP